MNDFGPARSPPKTYFHLSGDNGISARDTRKCHAGGRTGPKGGRRQHCLCSDAVLSDRVGVPWLPPPMATNWWLKPQAFILLQLLRQGVLNQGSPGGGSFLPLPASATAMSLRPSPSHSLPRVRASPLLCLISTRVPGRRAHPTSGAISPRDPESHL